MSNESKMVKKENLIYALLFGLVIGFIGGIVFSVYKLDSNTSGQPQPPAQQTAADSSGLDSQTMEAIRNMEAQVTANPDNVEAWTRLGHLYFDTGQVKNAIKAYTRSLELQPGDPNVLTDLGVMYRRDGQPEKAVESFEKAYSLQTDHVMSRLNKGIVLLYDLNRPEEAIATWEELLSINPGAKLNNGMPLKDAVEEVKKELENAKTAE